MSTVAATNASGLLHETRFLQRDLLKRKDYAGARTLRESVFVKAESIADGVKQGIRAKHDIEKKRLETAKTIALNQIQTNVNTRVEQLGAESDAQISRLQQKQDARLSTHFQRVLDTEDRKPMVMKPYVRDLQRSEKKLADFHEYEEAAQVRRKIQNLEVSERERLESEKELRIERAVALKQKQFEGDLGFLRTRSRNRHALAIFQARQEEERVKKQFAHIEEDMKHAHSLELQSDPALKKYARAKKKAQPVAANDADRARKGGAATRGTTYLLRMQGSRYDIPSLCELYGDNLDKGSAAKRTKSTEDFDLWHHQAVARESRPRQRPSTMQAQRSKSMF